MNQREMKIVHNMLALAKGRKGGGKRSLMLRTIMPHLSQDVGDALADAIQRNDAAKFSKNWDRVKREIAAKLDKHHSHKAHASAAGPVIADDLYRAICEHFRNLLGKSKPESS